MFPHALSASAVSCGDKAHLLFGFFLPGEVVISSTKASVTVYLLEMSVDGNNSHATVCQGRNVCNYPKECTAHERQS